MSCTALQVVPPVWLAACALLQDSASQQVVSSMPALASALTAALAGDKSRPCGSHHNTAVTTLRQCGERVHATCAVQQHRARCCAAMLCAARALGLMMPTQRRSSNRLHLQKLCSSHGWAPSCRQHWYRCRWAAVTGMCMHKLQQGVSRSQLGQVMCARGGCCMTCPSLASRH